MNCDIQYFKEPAEPYILLHLLYKKISVSKICRLEISHSDPMEKYIHPRISILGIRITYTLHNISLSSLTFTSINSCFCELIYKCIFRGTLHIDSTQFMFVLGMNLRTYPFDIVVHFYVILIVCRFVSQIDNDENRFYDV